MSKTNFKIKTKKMSNMQFNSCKKKKIENFYFIQTNKKIKKINKLLAF